MRNVLVILCDQLRKDFLPIYGCEAIKTPNIDRIAKMGVVFDRAITQSAVCAPARASMMTGRYVSDHGVWTNDVPFREGLEYIAPLMNSLGYNSGCYGKMHHYPALDMKGFQESATFEESRLGEKDPYYNWLAEKYPNIDKHFRYFFKNHQFIYPEEDYYENYIADNAIEFIDKQVNDNNPFFAWVSFQGPHDPYDPPSESKGTVDETKLPPMLHKDNQPGNSSLVRYRSVFSGRQVHSDERTAYAEMIVHIDKQIGKILDSIEDKNVLQNTTIVFSADHGDMLDDYDLFSKGPYPYENQLGIPLIVANHPNMPKGTRSDILVGNIDIPGTCLDIADSDLTIGYSRSIIKMYNNKNYQREVNYSEFDDSLKIVEDSTYRLCYYTFTGQTELYNMVDDPKQRYDLSGQTEYLAIERKLLMDIIDFITIAKGTRIEAHDLIPDVQQGLEKKNPNWKNDTPICYPLGSKVCLERLEEKGLSTTYNEFCKDMDIERHYGVYWEED